MIDYYERGEKSIAGVFSKLEYAELYKEVIKSKCEIQILQVDEPDQMQKICELDKKQKAANSLYYKRKSSKGRRLEIADNIVEKMKQLKSQGMSINAISKYFNFSYLVAFRILEPEKYLALKQKQSLTRKEKSLAARKASGKIIWDEQQQTKAVKLKESGLKPGEIAKLFGCHVDTVRYHLDPKRNIYTRVLNNEKKKRRRQAELPLD